MDSDLLFAIIVASSSFLSGFITLIIFCKKNKKTSNIDETYSDSVSARLPSLISIEIILLLWFLMCCTPLILLLWFYLPTHYGQQQTVNSIAYLLFVISFVPIYTTHIIRIWLLKLKFHITSLSMLNQLGMIKWKDIRDTFWTKIYYNHKWSHNIKILILISVIFDIIITAIYSIFLFIDIEYRLYLNVIIFGTLTLCLMIGTYSLKSFNDPFNIFREELIILSVWFAALATYVILYYFFWDQLLVLFFNESSWTIAVAFFGALAALISIIIHFYFNNKSIQTIHNNLPSLGIIVSTKEGLQTFLRFLVTELSVENLEFFTLSMRWRHRLVLRDLRREKRKSVKQTQFAFHQPHEHKISTSIVDLKIHNPLTPPSAETSTAHTQTITQHNVKSDKTGIKLANISELKTSDKSNITTILKGQQPTSKNIMHRTSKKLLALHKQPPANEAETHLQQLPFPMLTFEFLDRDVAKKQTLRRHNTMTETSYVLEFSRTKTLKLERNISDRETAVSVYFEQYDHICMQNNKSRITQLIQSAPKLNKTTTLSDNKQKSYTASLKEFDLDDLEHGITARSIGQTPEPPSVNIESSVKITPFATSDNREKNLNVDDFTLDVCEKENKNKSVEKLSVLNNNNFTFSGLYGDTNLDMYDKEWTEEFMSRKRVDYDRFNTLSEEINISSKARQNLRRFFKLYPSVKLFREAQISEYDNSFEIAWKNVWANLNDSLRRFHRSMFYKEWLHSNAANGLNVMPMHTISMK